MHKAPRNPRLFIRYGLIYFGLLVVCLWTVMPFLFLILTSFKYRADIINKVPQWIFTPTLSNYVKIIVEGEALKYLTNTTIVSLATAGFSLFLGVLAAYGFSRYEFRGKHHLEFYFLSTRMLPPITLALPFYIIFSKVGILGSYYTLIITYSLMNIPLVIWLMKDVFDQIPRSLDEAALIDGASRIVLFGRILVPLARGGIVVAGFFCIIFSWYDFIFAAVLTKPETWTVSVAISNLKQSLMIEWGPLTAFGVLGVIPILMLALLIQRHIIRGMTFGAVHG